MLHGRRSASLDCSWAVSLLAAALSVACSTAVAEMQHKELQPKKSLLSEVSLYTNSACVTRLTSDKTRECEVWYTEQDRRLLCRLVSVNMLHCSFWDYGLNRYTFCRFAKLRKTFGGYSSQFFRRVVNGIQQVYNIIWQTKLPELLAKNNWLGPAMADEISTRMSNAVVCSMVAFIQTTQW